MAGGVSTAARDDVAPVGATFAAGVDVLAGPGQGVTELSAKLGRGLGIEQVGLTVYL